jgi:anti-sigma regulatory factor (Ser/Thr protein kinase)
MPTHVPEAVAVDHQFDVNGLYALRAALTAHADHIGATADEIDQLLIIGGELATNAVRHGGGRGRLRLWRVGRHLYCQVTDEGGGMTDPEAGQIAAAPTALGGRGLWIIRQLADNVVIDTDRHGTTVTTAITLANPVDASIEHRELSTEHTAQTDAE